MHYRVSFVLGSLIAAAACMPAASPPPVARTDIDVPPAEPLEVREATGESCGTAGRRLPAAFCATIFADNVGSARHMVVASNGDLFINIQRGQPNSAAANISPGVLALRDTNGDGVADVRERFGNAGNTGIALYRGFLYQDIGPAIIRYPIHPGSLRPSRRATDTVVRNLPYLPGHRSRNFAIAEDGTMYVNVGSASNSCQVRNREAGSPGHDPCDELETRGGIWQFDANRTRQVFSPEARFATGIRNAVALALNPTTGALYSATHGRDQLHQSWPSLFTEEQGAELPAEEFQLIDRGDDFGWPYCYWDGRRRARVLAPEYGGDGQRQDRCVEREQPVAAFPAHWAPNALLFYTGTMFPPRYQGGAFIAFHGSWNRAPLPQGGYNVVFVPFSNGRVGRTWQLFADGFVPPDVQPATARNRPTGLAQAPDGTVYVSDDVGGRIWRITYRAQ
jgi:glucose/arabinose dehydrogenase